MASQTASPAYVELVHIVYMGVKDVDELKTHIVLPREITENVPDAYAVLFEDGMEMSPVGSPGASSRVWFVGRAARTGDCQAMTAEEADRRAARP